MIIVEFKKEVHEENVQRLYKLKDEICELIEKMSHGTHAERHHEDPYMLDERRGRGGRYMRRDNYPFDERGGQDGYRHDMPYDRDKMYSRDSEQFDNRYRY